MTTDPATTDIGSEEFLGKLEASGLSGIDEARVAATELATGSRIASRMVSTGSLTQYQAGILLHGQPSDLRMGNYEILDKLGAGGMGAVYKARHRRMKRVVALKVLNKSISQSALFAQRFQREVETIAKLQHPNIVMAFDADEGEQGPFLIMEFVDGRDLAVEVAEGGPLSVAEAVDCILQAARGLECAHQQGIIHRDIKPSNLMRDRSGIVKVTDLGLARLNSPGNPSADPFSITQAGSVLGTIDYMAPEQALDSTTVDARADIYSLGGTLYFLLAGKPPYQAGTLMAMLLKHREAPIPQLQDARSEIPHALAGIFQRMMAKKPEERFPSLAPLIDELDSLRRTGTLSDRKHRSGSSTTGVEILNDQTVLLQASPTDDTKAAAIDQETTTGSLKNTIVVLVEPSRTQAGIIRKLLEQLGITSIHSTDSGQSALELALRVQANVILSALHLKDQTGVQLANVLIAEPTCTGVGFVLATSESDQQELAGLPVNIRVSKLFKPFDLEKLQRAIASVRNLHGS